MVRAVGMLRVKTSDEGPSVEGAQVLRLAQCWKVILKRK